MLTVEEARARVLEAVDLLEPQDVLVGEARGLVAATDVRAPIRFPASITRRWMGTRFGGTTLDRPPRRPPCSSRWPVPRGPATAVTSRYGPGAR